MGFYQSNIGGATEGERPDLVPGCNPMVRKVSRVVESGMLRPAAIWHDRRRGRDSLNNPNYFNWDFAFIKNTKLTERVNVQLRAEFFDILNHPNFNVGPQAILLSSAEANHPDES